MRKKKILIVDDEPDFVNFMRIRLETNHFEVIEAYDGREGFQKFIAENPDAIILDILMPEVDGIEMFKAIREHNKDIPVFVVSALTATDRFPVFEKMGVSGCIQKGGDLRKELEQVFKIVNGLP